MPALLLATPMIASWIMMPITATATAGYIWQRPPPPVPSWVGPAPGANTRWAGHLAANLTMAAAPAAIYSVQNWATQLAYQVRCLRRCRRKRPPPCVCRQPRPRCVGVQDG